MITQSPREFKHYEISDDEFDYLRDLIYREAGIHLNETKKCLVQTRIGKLMRQFSIDGYQRLFKVLRDDKTGAHLTKVLDAISTNHTFFFREDSHFKYLSNKIIPDIKPLVRDHVVRIWSAGCSSGEEPYTIAITLLELFESMPGWDFQIFASDISTDVLAKAKAGIYGLDSLQAVPADVKRKYFQRGKGEFSNLVKVKDVVRQKISFDRHNLLEPLRKHRPFHIIFCRNVMIYFDQRTKENLVQNFYDKLVDGGMFVTGHSESLNSIKHPFKMHKPTIYQRQ